MEAAVAGLCVIGLQWGDEAKGKLVDWLADSHEIVVRYQGGANAGHTVVANGQTYKLHLIPSGILCPRTLNVVAAGVVVDPATLLREIDELRDRGIELSGRLLLSDRAHVVFPWHALEDRIWHELMSGEDNLGTTLRGIGPCYRDKVGRSFAVRLGDLIRPGLPQQIAAIAKYKQASLQSLPFREPITFDVAGITNEYVKYADRLRSYITDTTTLLLDAVDEDKPVLFEGAQGAMLDIDHGTFPFVTSSNSSGVGISAGSGVPPRFIQRTIGVVKAYSTRVGGGPFPTELHDEIGNHIRERGREYGTTTGRPRRCGWFDAVAVRYAARLSGANELAVTMLDVLSELDEIQVCVGYQLDGKLTRQFPSHADDLQRAQPVYEVYPGWQTDISHCTMFDELPAAARALVEQIAQLVGVPVETISVGPDRHQTISCHQDQFA
jgi:adenylosuccinate synthase